MRILLSPQVCEEQITYSFEGEAIHATIGEITDTFDFSSFPDGEIHSNDITTTLPIVPISFARRENGVLSVELINFISEEATHEECFPEWMEV